jgi:hypothetical protein
MILYKVPKGEERCKFSTITRIQVCRLKYQERERISMSF